MRSALEQEKWDLVLADHSMPQFNSGGALVLLQQSKIDIPFIIVSGNIGEEVAVEAMKSGAHDYIIKGNLARLIPAIQRELREASERRARKKAEETIRYLAYHDALTGLVNRSEFEIRLEELIADISNQDIEHALLYMDLDQFKVINDTCGHFGTIRWG